MHKYAVLAAATLSLVVAGILVGAAPIVAEAVSAKGSEQSKSLPKVDIEQHGINTRGMFRTQHFGANLMNNQSKVYEFDSTSEMDITSVTFTSVVVPNTATVTGTIYIYLASDGGGSTYPVNIITNGTETMQFTFATPIPVRSGDLLSMYKLSTTGTPTNMQWELTLNGTVPAVAKTNAAVAY